MHLAHQIHSTILSLAKQYPKELRWLKKALYVVIALQCFLCLQRCSDSHVSAINTVTINEDVLHGRQPITATSKIVITPGDQRCKPSNVSHGIGWLFSNIICMFGSLASNFFGIFVWMLECCLSKLWCYPKGLHIHSYKEENTGFTMPSGIFTPSEEAGSGIIEWLHSHLYVALAILGLPLLLFFLYKLVSFFIRSGYAGETLLQLNEDGNWEYAPSKKKSVVHHKYGSYNKPIKNI